MTEHPNEKDQRTGELHAKENQGGDKCERGTHKTLAVISISEYGGTFKAALIVN